MTSSLRHIIIAVVIASATLIGYGVWYSIISAKSTAVADLQNSIATKTETANRIAATRASLADIASDEAIVQNYFVPETSVVAFINSLEGKGKAQRATVSVLSVSTGGTAAHPALTLALTVKGTFEAVMRTVGSIEYAPYDLSITSLGVVQDAKNSWHADLKLLVGSTPTNAATSIP